MDSRYSSSVLLSSWYCVLHCKNAAFEDSSLFVKFCMLLYCCYFVVSRDIIF